MKKEHKEIINLISDYLKKHPEQRFGQAIFNLGIIEFINKTNPDQEDYGLRDIYNDQDSEIIGRIKTRLKLIEKIKTEDNNGEHS